MGCPYVADEEDGLWTWKTAANVVADNRKLGSSPYWGWAAADSLSSSRYVMLRNVAQPSDFAHSCRARCWIIRFYKTRKIVLFSRATVKLLRGLCFMNVINLSRFGWPTATTLLLFHCTVLKPKTWVLIRTANALFHWGASGEPLTTETRHCTN
jgi:hypothetical protein